MSGSPQPNWTERRKTGIKNIQSRKPGGIPASLAQAVQVNAVAMPHMIEINDEPRRSLHALGECRNIGYAGTLTVSGEIGMLSGDEYRYPLTW